MQVDGSLNKASSRHALLHCCACTRRITDVLEKNQTLRTAYACIFAFGSYLCIYGLRRPWSAAYYDRPGVVFLGGLQLKDGLVLCQTLGYWLGKISGTLLIPRVKMHQRCSVMLMLMLVALAPLGVMALVPDDRVMLACLFINGIPLAWFWGLLFLYLEGRDASEVLGASIASAIIVGGGLSKSVGSFLVVNDSGGGWFDESAMPVAAGAAYLPLAAMFVMGLDLLPPPSAGEVGRRGERVTMTRADQCGFLSRFFLGLLPLFVANAVLTALRDFRDSFVLDMWREIFNEDMPSVLFTLTEAPVAGLVLLVLALISLVRSNARAFYTILGAMLVAVVIVSTTQIFSAQLFALGTAGGTAWTLLTGLGIFLAYVPMSAMIYDRLVGMLGVRATAVFAIQCSDSLGYLGSIGLILFKNYGSADFNYSELFIDAGTLGGAVCAVCFGLAAMFFHFSAGPPPASDERARRASETKALLRDAEDHF